MDYVKNRDFFIQIISVIIIVASLGFLFKKPEQRQQLSSHMPAKIASKNIKQTAKMIMTVPKKIPVTRGPAYNYENMMKLVEKQREVEKLFYTQFDTFIKDPKNLTFIKDTLSKLKNEQYTFINYIQQIKAYHKRHVPNKKQNALRYYLRILEDGIDNLKEIKGKFKLHSQAESTQNVS